MKQQDLLRNIKHFVFIVALIFTSDISYCQITRTDSLIIEKLGAISLTDTVSSIIPLNEKELIIDLLKKNNFNPNEYYTLKRNAQKQIKIVLKDKSKREVYCINLLRIAALRELANGPIHEGALGYPGDDINIAYDPKFKQVFFLGESQ